MIVRDANKFDLPYFIDLIHRINEDDGLGDVICGELDDNHINAVFATILAGAGICYIAESDERVGIIVGVISPNMWALVYASNTLLCRRRISSYQSRIHVIQTI